MPKSVSLHPKSRVDLNPIKRFDYKSNKYRWDSTKQDFVRKVSISHLNDKHFDSKLEIPNGRNPNQHAWLTITISYRINFIDGRRPNSSIVRDKNGQFSVVDSNNNLFPIVNWNSNTRKAFRSRFKLAESFWNHKFLLITPMDYDGLDYTSMSETGWCVRPNILCLFRLKEGKRISKRIKTNFASRVFNVVRLKDNSQTQFRENLDILTKNTSRTTFAHELGHALKMLHIKALRGGLKCTLGSHLADEDCYDGYSKKDQQNIMGRGNKITYVNATPWVSAIEKHTNQHFSKWRVSMNTEVLPRKIPLGVAQVAKPERF